MVIYQDRAEIKRAVPAHLTPGENEVIVYDLEECVDKNSIRYSTIVKRPPPIYAHAPHYMMHVKINDLWVP